jgi:molecular chaperone HscB
MLFKDLVACSLIPFHQGQQDLAHTLSSRLNEAYQCLSSPLPRAEYILERNGAQTTESDSLEGAPFMTKIMEARELIDEATPEDRSKIEQLVENTHR